MWACGLCPFGKYAPIEGSDCLSCELGKYQSLEGQSSCESCPAGTFSIDFGATSGLQCKECPAGSASKNGSSTCVPCEGGFFAGPMSRDCKKCPAGYSSNNAKTDCNRW